MAKTPPIALVNVGDQYTKGCVMDCIVVRGFVDVGNTFQICDAVTSAPLVDTTGTTLGAGFYNLGSGIDAPNGFKLTAKSGATYVTTGIIYVYTR